MISAQDLIEKITSTATCDDCIVVVKDKTQANLRWAGSTLTTNGVIQERNVTVIAFVSTEAIPPSVETKIGIAPDFVGSDR